MSLREFWMQVYIAAVRHGLPPDLAKESANAAITAWRESWEGLKP